LVALDLWTLEVIHASENATDNAIDRIDNLSAQLLTPLLRLLSPGHTSTKPNSIMLKLLIFNFQVVARLVCSEGLLAGSLLKRADNRSLVRSVEPISLLFSKLVKIRRSSYHRQQYVAFQIRRTPFLFPYPMSALITPLSVWFPHRTTWLWEILSASLGSFFSSRSTFIPHDFRLQGETPMVKERRVISCSSNTRDVVLETITSAICDLAISWQQRFPI
jgi:hypothetical protein